MCREETQQAYVVLRAFEEAGRHVSFTELENEIQSIIEKHGYESIESLGPHSLGYLLHEFSKGHKIETNNSYKSRLTESGHLLKGVLGSFVEESYPELVT